MIWPIKVWAGRSGVLAARPGLRGLGVLLAGVLVVVSASAQTGQADGVADFEARLQVLRNALIDATLEGPTQIRNSAWIDSEGRLHESTAIRAGAVVRGVRVERYLEEAGVLDHRAEMASVEGLPVETLFCGMLGHGLKRQALLELEPARAASGGGTAFPALVLERSAQLLIERAQATGEWVVDPARRFSSSYERLVSGRDLDRVPYRMRLSVTQPEQRQAGAALLTQLHRSVMDGNNVQRNAPSHVLALSLSVETQPDGEVVWQDFAMLRKPAETPRLGRLGLPDGMALELESIVAAWLTNLAEVFECHPLYFKLHNAGAESAELNAGYRAGVRQGDLFVISDKTRLPGHILETGALESMVLVKAERVSANAALVRRVAGPPISAHPALVAMPF